MNARQKYEGARYPGTSVQDVLKQDSHAVPRYLRDESYTFLGDEDIPYERYTSQHIFQQELERLWTRVWQWACREEHLPDPGDYLVYDIGPYSILLVRTESRQIKAYRNSCMHRGTKLKPSFSEGSAATIRCPYHGWTWSLDGSLKSMPCHWDFPHVDPKDFGLSEVRVDMWGGFVFINLDPSAESLVDYLQPLPTHVSSVVFENRYVAMHVEKELNCNWKIASEAFLEAYHVMETHPQLMRTCGDANTQYDFYSDNVNRLICLGGIPSQFLDVKMTEQQILDSFLTGDGSNVSSKLAVPPGGTARRVMAQYLRELSAAQKGPDLSQNCDSEMVDSIAYFVFPNQQFFVGVGFPIVYRFRPNGMRADRSLFDLIILKTRPNDGTPIQTAVPVRVKAEDSYTTVPGMDPYLGHVFDQDTSNMAAAQEGAMTAEKRGATLGNYQEIRIRHMHKTLEKYLRD